MKILRTLGILITIACLIASVSIMPMTTSAVTSLIPDDNLRKAINEQLVDNGSQGIDIDTHEPTQAELESLTELIAVDKGINSLEGLGKATNLTKLDLGSNNISNISSLGSLNDLTLLYLLQNDISDISSISGLNRLEVLYINYNDISDISPLIGHSELRALFAGNNNISDISPLSNLTKIESLDLSTNEISDISSLSNLLKIKHLQLKENRISDISPLIDIKNGGANISGVNQIVTLAEKELFISDTTITTVNPIINMDGAKVIPDPTSYTGSYTIPEITWTGMMGTETELKFEYVAYDGGSGWMIDGTVIQPIKWITPNEAPVIDATDQTIQVGDTFDALAGVTATDAEDGDLTSEISVTKNEVDTTTAGDYEVTYEVTDSDGETTTKTIKITVEEANKNQPTEPEVTQVQVVPGVTVDKGIAKNDLGLPTEVRIELDNGDQPMVNVIWDEGTPEYDQDVVGTYEFVGILVLPDGVNNVADIKAWTVVKVDGEITDPTEPTDPTYQEDSKITEPSDDDFSKITIESEDEDSDDGTKNKLPKTATSVFNLLALGLGLLAIGAVIILLTRRKRSA